MRSRRFLAGLLALSTVACAPSVAPTSSPEPGWTPPPLPPGAAADCDGLPGSVCYQAASVAFAFGLATAADQVVGWRARPTRVTVCDGVSTPKFDVTFRFRDGATFKVTVAEGPSGRLVACTY